MVDTDAVVIGAGVIGLACARELAVRGLSVLVLERHERFGVETSSRNSEVIHAGLYYTPGSLKAVLCARGNRSVVAWCDAHAVPYRRTGKLIVAVEPAESARLDEIHARARANGVTSLERLGTADVRAREPHVRAHEALWSPDTGIVDSHAFMASLLADAEFHGATFTWRTALTAATRRGDGWDVTAVSAGEAPFTLRARGVVNAAGLEADRVAALAGADVAAWGYALHYARGHYFRVHAAKAHLARHLIYPVPGPDGLGIHVTLDLAGGLRLGPDVQYTGGRAQDYAVDPARAADFHRAVSRYLEGLEPGDLAPDLAGIRPKLQAPGGPVRDFVVREESDRGLPGWVNLIGIESPGLTCSLEIGTMVADLMTTPA